MWTTKIANNQVEETLNVEYYHPKYLELEEKLERGPFKLRKLSDISKLITDGDHGKIHCVQEGIPFLTSQNIMEEEIEINNVRYITREKHEELARSKLASGDVLLTKTGRIGIATVVPKEIGECNIIAHIARIVLKKDINPYFVATFLNSQYGRFQTERFSHKGTRPEFKLVEVEKIRIPVVDKQTENEIIEMMQNAYKEKKEKIHTAEKLLESVNDIFLKELRIKLPKIEDRKTFSISCSNLEGRFDVDYYQPKYMSALRALYKGKYEVESLEKFIRDIKYGASLKAYKEGEIPFLTIQNLKAGTLDLTEILYVKTEDKDKLTKSDFVKIGDILISRSGSIGITAVISKETRNFAFGSYMIKLCLIKGTNPKYISAFLNSKLGSLQTQRLRTGTIQTNITIPAIRLIKIPVPLRPTQDKIVEEVRRIREEVRKLRLEAEEGVRNAKIKVDQMLLKLD